MPVSPPLVLVVHRDAAAGQRLTTALQAAGYAVQSERDGLDGLLTVEHHHPALVVLDWHLPFLDGALFMRALRIWAPVRPAVIALVTAADDPTMVQHLGAAAVLAAGDAATPEPVVRLVRELLLDQPAEGAS
jgi:DNA-binding response OmpR family regulator